MHFVFENIFLIETIIEIILLIGVVIIPLHVHRSNLVFVFNSRLHVPKRICGRSQWIAASHALVYHAVSGVCDVTESKEIRVLLGVEPPV